MKSQNQKPDGRLIRCYGRGSHGRHSVDQSVNCSPGCIWELLWELFWKHRFPGRNGRHAFHNISEQVHWLFLSTYSDSTLITCTALTVRKERARSEGKSADVHGGRIWVVGLPTLYNMSMHNFSWGGKQKNVLGNGKGKLKTELDYKRHW